MALELDDHTVSVARDGHDGVAQARQFLPDVILCDLGLPGMDGYEVARAIKDDATLQGIYLVALSGHGFAEDRRRTHSAGFDQHLVKPLNWNDLTQILERG